MKRELPSQNGKINSKNRPKMKTNANKKKSERGEGQEYDLMEHGSRELERRGRGLGRGWV